MTSCGLRPLAGARPAPERSWLRLRVLPGGSAVERERAAAWPVPFRGRRRPGDEHPDLAGLLAGAGRGRGRYRPDASGGGLKIPTVAIYTATDPGLTGVLGAGFIATWGQGSDTGSRGCAWRIAGGAGLMARFAYIAASLSHHAIDLVAPVVAGAQAAGVFAPSWRALRFYPQAAPEN